MFKRFTDGYFALGLVIGGAVVLILALSVSEYGAGCYLANGDAYGYNPESVEPNKRCWLIPFFVYSEDTLAQWIMAILTIAAVWMLWRTLNLTRGANDAAVKAATAALEANKIMRQEQRPWVKIEFEHACRTTSKGVIFEMRCYVENIGKRPALIRQCEFRRCEDYNSFSARADAVISRYLKKPVNVEEHGLWPLFPNERIHATSIAFDTASHASPLLEIEVFIFYADMSGGEWNYNVATFEFGLHAKDRTRRVADCKSVDEVTCVTAPRDGGTQKIR